MRRWSLGGAYRRVARGPWRAYTRGLAKGFVKNGAAALMREANEIGSGSGAFVACMSDPSNATAMLVLSIISTLQTFSPLLVFIVFDVCNTVPDGGHNQADPPKQM